MLKYNAMPGMLIVRRKSRKEKKVGLLFLPETRRYKETLCEVLSVGKRKPNDHGYYIGDEVQVGDLVHVLGYDGTQLEPLDDPELILIEGEMVWAVIKEVPAGDTNGIEVNVEEWNPYG